MNSIPDKALDDSLGIVGTIGSGKTYTATGAEERILARGGRVIHVDPLGVAWGLRLDADGEHPSPFNVVIFGGPHGDVPITPNSGALIGETVASMRESCIIDLSPTSPDRPEFESDAAERRFMLAFLTALYKHASREPVHLILDEADMWAPQRIFDASGDAAKLLGRVQTIVRRGRVAGFIPWLITQRPAVLNKDVLSMVYGLIAMKLVSPQDRNALKAWIELQADADKGKDILAALPGMRAGEGVVWLPHHGLLETVHFPPKLTYDSSRTPKRGERRDAVLQPIDIAALRVALATVEAEAKANDPRELKARIASLEAELARGGPDPIALRAAYDDGFRAALVDRAKGHRAALAELRPQIAQVNRAAANLQAAATIVERRFQDTSKIGPPVVFRAKEPNTGPPVTIPVLRGRPVPARRQNGSALGKGPQSILNALAWWRAIGHEAPTMAQVAFVARYSHRTGTFGDYRSRLKVAGLIELDGEGRMRLTSEGAQQAAAPPGKPTMAELHERVRDVVRQGGPRKMLDVLLHEYPRAISMQRWGELSDYSHETGTFGDYRSRLKTLDLITYPARGTVRASDWLYP